MRALPTRRRVVPTAFMALGFTLTIAGSFGFSPVSSADEGPTPTSIVHESGGYSNYPTTTVPETTTSTYETTTTVPETTTTAYQTTTVPKTTTTVPQTTTTVGQTTTTVGQTTTTVAKTTTTVPVSVSPQTTVKPRTTVTTLAVTGSNSSLPMVGLGVSLFVFGLILFEIRAARTV